MTSETSAIKATCGPYLDGLHEGDADKIAAAFHPVSHLYSETDGAGRRCVPRDKWLDMVRGRGHRQKAQGLPRHDPHRDHRSVGAVTAFAKGRVRRCRRGSSSTT